MLGLFSYFAVTYCDFSSDISINKSLLDSLQNVVPGFKWQIQGASEWIIPEYCGKFQEKSSQLSNYDDTPCAWTVFEYLSIIQAFININTAT